MTRRISVRHPLPLALLAVLAACEPSDPTAISGFKPPLAVEGEYAGTVLLTIRGVARTDAMSEQAALTLPALDSVNNVKGTIQIAAAQAGRFEGTYMGRDSSIVVRLLGPSQRQSLGWAAFLPALLPQCDWTEAEVSEAHTKVDLRGLVLNGDVDLLCTDEALNGSLEPAPVEVDVFLNLRKTSAGGGTVH